MHVLLVCVCWATCGQTAEAPAPETSEAPAAARAEILAQFQQEAATYQIKRQADRPVQLKLAEQPLLHWGNPARNGEDGAVFVWMHAGRPEVIGSIWTFVHRSRQAVVRKNAFHSLSESPLEARFEQTVAWAPKSAGVQFQPVPGAPEPADTPRRRLSEMRSLAREFSAQLDDQRSGVSELRLLTQPLLRYQPTEGPAVDGAIFALAVGTDPEALLILEARRGKQRLEWQFAFARFHFQQLTGSHRGTEVWRAERIPEMAFQTFGAQRYFAEPYYSFMRD